MLRLLGVRFTILCRYIQAVISQVMPQQAILETGYLFSDFIEVYPEAIVPIIPTSRSARDRGTGRYGKRPVPPVIGYVVVFNSLGSHRISRVKCL